MSNRYSKKRSPEDYAPKIIHAELSEKNIRLRLILVLALIAMAAGAFTYAISKSMTYESGWEAVTVSDSAETNLSGDYVFYFDLGQEGRSASTDHRAVTELYTTLSEKAYQLFSEDSEDDETKGIAYLNAHPNENITVDHDLYTVLEKLSSEGGSALCMGPLYEAYYDLFYSTDESQEETLDPEESEPLKEMFAGVIGFINDGSVSLAFPAEDEVCLNVSEEYLSFISEWEIRDIIGFGPYESAVIIDYLADGMIAEDFTHGYISSYDGKTRNLGGETVRFSTNLYHRIDRTIYYVGALSYTGSLSSVVLRDFCLDEDNEYAYKTVSSGETRCLYLNPETGFTQTASDALTVYSNSLSCTDLMLKTVPLYTEETLDTEAVKALLKENIGTVYYDGFTVYHHGSCEITELYSDDSVTFNLDED